MGQAGFGGGLNAPPAGSRPQKRNPVVTLLIAWGGAVGANIVGNILAGIVSPFLAYPFQLVGMLWVGFIMFKMAQELKAFTNNQDFAPWMAFVPCLNIWFFVLKVPEEMTRAKQMAGVQNPTKGIVLYLFIAPFALASDLNDLSGQ